MKVEQGSSFKKLIAGTIDSARVDSGASTNSPTVPEKSIQDATQKNVEAASSISQVATEGVEAKRASEADRAEVESTVQEASRVKVEDVTNAADDIANRIRDNPDRAFTAQANQVNATVQRLLQ